MKKNSIITLKPLTSTLNSKKEINSVSNISVSNSSNSLKLKSGKYFLYNDFNEYRDSMISQINSNQISNSFSDLRKLVTSFKDILQTSTNKTNLEHLANIKKIESEFLVSDSIDENIIKNSNNKNDKKLNREQIAKLLSNLQIYLNNNLTEINLLKNSSSASLIKKKKNSYKQSNNDSMIQSMMSKNDNNLKLEAVNQTVNSLKKNTNNIEKINDELMIMEKKIHQKEIEKLLEKTNNLNEILHELDKTLKHTTDEMSIYLNKLQNSIVISYVKISEITNEDFSNSECDKKNFLNELKFEDNFLCLWKDKILFYREMKEMIEYFSFEINSISDILYYKNNNIIDLNESYHSETDLSNKVENETDINNFNGFQIRIQPNKYIFIKVNSNLEMNKLDSIFFILYQKKKLKNCELLYRNPKIGTNYSSNFFKEDNEKLSPNHSIKKMQGSVIDFDFSNFQNSIINDKNTFSLTKLESEKIVKNKKKTFINSQYKTDNQIITKKLSILNSSANLNDQNIDKMYRSSNKDMIIPNENEIITKSLRLKDTYYDRKSNKEKQNSPEHKYCKVTKILSNGYVFLKYGKYGDPHERLVVLNSKEKNLEWKAFSKKKFTGKIKIQTIYDIKEGRTTPNFQKFKKNNDFHLEEASFSIFASERTLDIVAPCEEIKKKFLEELKFYLNKTCNKNFNIQNSP